jgi:hypothetical protein
MSLYWTKIYVLYETLPRLLQSMRVRVKKSDGTSTNLQLILYHRVSHAYWSPAL